MRRERGEEDPIDQLAGCSLDFLVVGGEREDRLYCGCEHFES